MIDRVESKKGRWEWLVFSQDILLIRKFGSYVKK